MQPGGSRGDVYLGQLTRFPWQVGLSSGFRGSLFVEQSKHMTWNTQKVLPSYWHEFPADPLI